MQNHPSHSAIGPANLSSATSISDAVIPLFHEPKLFWRERINVDLAIRLFPATSVVEINAYNLDDDVESPKIYCDKDKLYSRLYESEVEAKVREAQQELSHKRKPMLPVADLTESVRRKLIVEFIIMRLNIKREKKKITKDGPVILKTCERCLRYEKCIKCSASEKEARRIAQEKGIKEEWVIDPSSFRISFDPLPDENPFDFFVVDPGSLNLQILTLARRRRTNATDFQDELSNFRAAQESLSDASAAAAHKAGLAAQSVDGFKKTRKKNVYDTRLYSQARIRWMKAIHRIILQNAVTSYTTQWERSIHNPNRIIDDEPVKNFAFGEGARFSESCTIGEAEGNTGEYIDFDELDYRASFSSRLSRASRNSSERNSFTLRDRRTPSVSFVDDRTQIQPTEVPNSSRRPSINERRRHTTDFQDSASISHRVSIDSTNTEEVLPPIGNGSSGGGGPTRSSFSRYSREKRNSLGSKSSNHLPSVTEVNRIDIISSLNHVRKLFETPDEV